MRDRRRQPARARWLACLGLALQGPVLAGCGDGKSDEPAVSSPRPATTTTAPAGPPSTASTTSPAAGDTAGSDTRTASGGGEEPVRVPVTLAFRADGTVDPPTVTVPAFVAVQVTLASRDGRAHVLRLRDRDRTYRLAVGPGKRETSKLPGLRAGSYRLQSAGGGRGVTLMVGGEVGP